MEFDLNFEIYVPIPNIYCSSEQWILIFFRLLCPIWKHAKTVKPPISEEYKEVNHKKQTIYLDRLEPLPFACHAYTDLSSKFFEDCRLVYTSLFVLCLLCFSLLYFLLNLSLYFLRSWKTIRKSFFFFPLQNQMLIPRFSFSTVGFGR